jgi:hypothetical protein
VLNFKQKVASPNNLFKLNDEIYRVQKNNISSVFSIRPIDDFEFEDAVDVIGEF